MTSTTPSRFDLSGLKSPKSAIMASDRRTDSDGDGGSVMLALWKILYNTNHNVRIFMALQPDEFGHLSSFILQRVDPCIIVSFQNIMGEVKYRILK